MLSFCELKNKKKLDKKNVYFKLTNVNLWKK